jgi:hypothetical protein
MSLAIYGHSSVYHLSSDLTEEELLSELAYRSIDCVRDGEWL